MCIRDRFNGSSGYEEAAAQGLVAGINAARKLQGKSAVISAQVAAIRAERSRLAAALAACPCIGQVYPSEGNFLLVKTCLLYTSRCV